MSFALWSCSALALQSCVQAARMPSSLGLDCTKLAHQICAFCKTQSCPRPADDPFYPWAAEQGWDMLPARAEGRELCAAGGSQLPEDAVRCSQVPRLPLCGCCVTAEMHQAARARGRACTGALLSVRVVTVFSSEWQSESRTSFNLCTDQRHTMSALRFVFSWLQLHICQGKMFGSSSLCAK